MKKTNEIVREGYDQLATAYREHYRNVHSTYYPLWLESFLSLIPEGSKVLELGCADGIPVAQRLREHYQYVGIDISPVQIAQARLNVPTAHFEVADMTALSFPAGAFSGIVALYSIIHVPLAQQPALITSMYQWLQKGGALLAVVGAGAWTGIENDWLQPGISMYWSHTDTATYLQWFSSVGFTMVDTQFVPEGEGGHTLLVARKDS